MFTGYLFLATCVLNPIPPGVPLFERCKPVMEATYNSAEECSADVTRLMKANRTYKGLCLPIGRQP